MAGTNDFLPFATAGGANVLSQSAYAALAAVATGYQAGVAQSAQLNKTWRQSSIIASMVAQFIVDQTGANAVDDGTIATLEANFIAALRYAGVAVGTDTGSANTCIVNYTPAIPSLVDGMVLWFKAAVANTGATTLNVNGLGAKAVIGGAHSALQGGEIVANGKCMVVYNATLSSFVLIGCTGGALQVGVATQGAHALQRQQKGVVSFTSSGSFVVPPGVTQIWASGCGGGGGGGGGAGCPSYTSALASGGGGGGGNATAVIRNAIAVTPGHTLTITIGGAGPAGPGGAAGANNGGNGGLGGNTGINDGATNLLTIGGGIGGLGSVTPAGAASAAAGGAGGSFGGAAGGFGIYSSTATLSGMGGAGGSGPFGSGGNPGTSVGVTSNGVNAFPAGGYGSGGGGGSGGATAPSAAAVAGGAGTPGQQGILFIEY